MVVAAMVESLPPIEIPGHVSSGLGNEHHPMRIMTRRTAGLDSDGGTRRPSMRHRSCSTLWLRSGTPGPHLSAPKWCETLFGEVTTPSLASAIYWSRLAQGLGPIRVFSPSATRRFLP